MPKLAVEVRDIKRALNLKTLINELLEGGMD